MVVKFCPLRPPHFVIFLWPWIFQVCEIGAPTKTPTLKEDLKLVPPKKRWGRPRLATTSSRCDPGHFISSLQFTACWHATGPEKWRSSRRRWSFSGPKNDFQQKKTGAKRWSPGWIQWFLFATKQTYPRCCNVSGQMIIFHQPRLSICWGGSPTTLLFGVRSCEVAIIWVDVWIICLHERWTMVTCKEKWLVNIPVSWILWDMMV